MSRSRPGLSITLSGTAPGAGGRCDSVCPGSRVSVGSRVVLLLGIRALATFGIEWKTPRMITLASRCSSQSRPVARSPTTVPTPAEPMTTSVPVARVKPKNARGAPPASTTVPNLAACPYRRLPDAVVPVPVRVGSSRFPVICAAVKPAARRTADNERSGEGGSVKGVTRSAAQHQRRRARQRRCRRRGKARSASPPFLC